MKKVIIILIILLFFVGGIIFLRPSKSSILFLLNNSYDNIDLWNMENTPPDIIDEIRKKLEDLIYKIEHGDITHGLNDLAPMPQDVLYCEEAGCTNPCNKIDYSLEKTTHRLMQDVVDGGNKYKMDWQYDGWTVNEGTFWDIDFSKFSDRTTVNQDKEYLFKWGINNYLSTTKGGKQRFTFEYRNHNYTPGMIKFDESTRNGSFVKTVDGNEYLDLGPNGLFSSQDGRIKSAFAPIVTAGPVALQNLVKAKGWFHRGDVWYGSEDSFRGIHLWQDAVPKGTYIDVVFQNNTTGKQIVIPFIYSDAKNIHNFGSAGQRVDQRYGQCRANIQKSGTNGYREAKTTTYNCSVMRIAESLEDYMIEHPGEASTFSVAALAQIKQFLPKLDAYYFFDGQTINEVPAGNKEVLENRLLLLNDNTIGRFVNWKSNETTETILNYSDDDQITYTAHTALELINIAIPAAITMDNNNYIARVLLDGFYFSGNNNYELPNWSLVGMRVYPGTADLNNTENSFLNTSKNIPTVTSIDSTNKVIKFCDPGCKCSMCLTAQAR